MGEAVNCEINAIEFIEELKQIKGAIQYDGDASVQVLLPQKDGRTLRVGVTDDDVSDGKLWWDHYKGLFGEIQQE